MNLLVTDNGLATFDLRLGAELSRRKLVAALTASQVHVVIVERPREDLRSSLVHARNEFTRVSPSELAELQSINVELTERADVRAAMRTFAALWELREIFTSHTDRPVTKIACDTRLVDMFSVLEAHRSLLEMRGLVLTPMGLRTPSTTHRSNAWDGKKLAAAARLIEVRAFSYYADVLGIVEQHARDVARNLGTKPDARERYTTLRDTARRLRPLAEQAAQIRGRRR